jgi:hypothetical protein
MYRNNLYLSSNEKQTYSVIFVSKFIANGDPSIV